MFSKDFWVQRLWPDKDRLTSDDVLGGQRGLIFQLGVNLRNFTIRVEKRVPVLASLRSSFWNEYRILQSLFSLCLRDPAFRWRVESIPVPSRLVAS